MKFMEVLMNVVCRIVSTAVVNEYTFCVNEQQKVYVRMVWYLFQPTVNDMQYNTIRTSLIC